MDAPSDSQLLDAFDDIKGPGSRHRAYADFKGFCAAIEKFKPDCMREVLHTAQLEEVAERFPHPSVVLPRVAPRPRRREHSEVVVRARRCGVQEEEPPARAPRKRRRANKLRFDEGEKLQARKPLEESHFLCHRPADSRCPDCEAAKMAAAPGGRVPEGEAVRRQQLTA